MKTTRLAWTTALVAGAMALSVALPAAAQSPSAAAPLRADGKTVTLMVGVTINLFTVVVASRMFYELWARGFGRKTHLDIG